MKFSFYFLALLSTTLNLSCKSIDKENKTNTKNFSFGTVNPKNKFANAIDKPINQIDFSTIPLWTSSKTIDEVYQSFRDERYYDWSWINDKGEKISFKRRMPWLTFDSCFIKADEMSRRLKESFGQESKKIFLFGGHAGLFSMTEIRKEFDSSPTSFGYHVAPIVKVKNKIMVIDPLIDMERPLLVEEWISKLKRDNSEITASICSRETYEKTDECIEPGIVYTPQSAKSRHEDFMNTLTTEYRLIAAIKKVDPVIYLGEKAPWMKD